jgi:hypothetical protein
VRIIFDKIKKSKSIVFVGIITIVLFIANHFEALQPEKEIRNSVSTIGVYKKEAETIGNNLIFSYRSPDVYILTKNFEVYASRDEIVNYYKKNLVDTGWKFTGKSENIDHSNNRKIGESFDFRKGKYELGLYFDIQDLENYRIDNGKPLKYSITVHPKQ